MMWPWTRKPRVLGVTQPISVKAIDAISERVCKESSETVEKSQEANTQLQRVQRSADAFGELIEDMQTRRAELIEDLQKQMGDNGALYAEAKKHL